MVKNQRMKKFWIYVISFVAIFIISRVSKTVFDFVPISPVKNLVIVPVEEISPEILLELEKLFKDQFTFSVRIEQQRPLVEEAYEKSRGQIDGKAAINKWVGSKRSGTIEILVTNTDIYSDDMNFLFSIADKHKKVILVSLARLRNKDDGNQVEPKVIALRQFKTILRPLGKVMGLKSEDCAMAYSNSLLELDNKSIEYCPEDIKRLNKKKLLRTST